MRKQIQCIIKGMKRDLAISKSDTEFSFENKNIRITSVEDNTLMTITNEKGTKEIDLDLDLSGTVLGHTTINNTAVLFITKDTDKPDYIYKLDSDRGNFFIELLYNGNLGFSHTNPIEAIGIYENELIQKVYWTDGLNQPRVINITADSTTKNKWSDTTFNFVPTLRSNELVNIERSDINRGTFSPGVLQYVFTYYNKYGQESNIAYQSPLYYTSYVNRGGSPESKVSNSFNISIDNFDDSFDYLRLYSIHRTSLDAIPTVKRVIDLKLYNLEHVQGTNRFSYDSKNIKLVKGDTYTLLDDKPYQGGGFLSYYYWTLYEGNYDKICFYNRDVLEHTIQLKSTKRYTIRQNKNSSFVIISPLDDEVITTEKVSNVSYVDTGTEGEIIDPTELLYVGGEDILANTITHKDNTLFLGGYTLNKKNIPDDVKEFFRLGDITYATDDFKTIKPTEPYGSYVYDNQLKLDSSKIKTFKYLEYYRFGVQFLHYTGKWSEPVWINDVKNDKPILTTFYDDSDIKLPYAYYDFFNSTIIQTLYKAGYIKVRPVIVYPELKDRECICQGVLCPTVYNYKDRYDNAPFAQSSWFVRPNAPFDIDRSVDDYVELGKTESEVDGKKSSVSRGGLLFNNKDKSIDNARLNTVYTGSWLEFRANKSLPTNDNRNCEIQNTNRIVKNNDSRSGGFTAANSHIFMIDQNLVTLHSPDIEFDDTIQNLDTTNLKLRIVGVVPLTANSSDLDIQTSTPPLTLKDNHSGKVGSGFYSPNFGSTNIFTKFSNTESWTSKNSMSNFGFRSLVAGLFWRDGIYNLKDDYTETVESWFMVYPFHKNGSVANQSSPNEDNYTISKLSTKKMSNLRYSYKTQYLSTVNIWNAYRENDTLRTGISDVQIFNSNEVSMLKLKPPVNSGTTEITYYGNIDKVITQAVNINDNYNIVVGTILGSGIDSDGYVTHDINALDSKYTDANTSNSPISMKYKSTPHAVLALNYSKGPNKIGYQRVLPTIDEITFNGTNLGSINSVDDTDRSKPVSYGFYWEKNNDVVDFEDYYYTGRTSQDIIDIGITGNIKNDVVGGLQHGWLWLGELYNDNVVNRFGGSSEEAFQNNIWLPCGEAVSIVGKDSIIIKWTEGDTYFQRYDHLKTYPTTLEDTNAIVDIVSFMCETRVNIDGRYDRNRGLKDNLSISPTNFNLLNDVYSQSNNFFTYRILDSKVFQLDYFPNTITWTKEKQLGSIVDTWTNITLASLLDLDGDKGSITSLKTFNNEIFCFQQTGFSNILFNSRVQLNTSDGVPIEISNNYKVDGKRYISSNIGCVNKWSICETPLGLYFIDDTNSSIYLYNGQMNNISDSLGFKVWIKDNKGVGSWNPKDFNNFITYYDKINNDVYFTTKDSCLRYSELLGNFVSFMSYEQVPSMFNLDTSLISYKDGKLWEHYKGDYNSFYGEFQPYYITYKINPDGITDKIFDTLEFRSDSYDNGTLVNKTFDTLEVWNEYQYGKSSLKFCKFTPSTLKQKFRIWRANIPRDSKHKLDRIRNPWMFLKLSMNDENTLKTQLHDIVVNYFN